MYTLRPYQQEIYNSVRDGLKVSKKLLVQAVTRSGKTIIFSYMAKKFDDKNIPVMILTHRQEIFNQTFEKVIDFGINAGQIKSSKPITKNNVQVAMVGTVRSRLKKQERVRKNLGTKNVKIIDEPKVVIIDESHHAVSKTWSWVLSQFPNAVIIGFTATPVRLDNKPLCPLFDTLICGDSMKKMIDNYWITDFHHLCPPSPIEEMKINMKGGDYDKEKQQKHLTTITAAANILKYYKKYLSGLQTICFCCNMKHADFMKEYFNNAGYKSQIIHAKSKNRKKIIDDYKNGKYPILISIDIVSEGFDIPVCYGVLLLRKTKSLSLYLQQVSRCLTPVYADGYNIEIKEERKKAMMKAKPRGIILDFVGNVFEHGSIDMDRDWHSMFNPDQKKTKKKTMIEKKQCPGCGFWFPGSVKICDICGHDFDKEIKIQKQIKVEELAGELINFKEFDQNEAHSLAGTIERIKTYKNKNRAMFAILHDSMKYENEMKVKAKIKSMVKGLGYNKKYERVVWQRLIDAKKKREIA